MLLYYRLYLISRSYHVAESILRIYNSTNNALVFNLGPHELEIVDHYKYLGVYFSKSGSFLYARKHIAVQARKALHLLYMRINNLHLPVDLQLKLFDNTVLPILTYGSEVFGYENLQMLERIHTEFLRKITKTRKSTPLYMLYAELGRYPIELTVKCRMINFWNRIITGKLSKILFTLYSALRVTPNFESKWLKNIKGILNEAGRPDLWHTQNNISSTNISRIIKARLHTRLTMYYIRALIYDFLSGFLYVLVLEALRSVLETLRCVLVTM